MKTKRISTLTSDKKKVKTCIKKECLFFIFIGLLSHFPNFGYSAISDKNLITSKINLSYTIEKNEKLKALQNSISGVITDEAGVPISGANVVVKGTTTGAAADFDGNYSIQANSGDILVFTSIGFKTTEVTVLEATTINVTMLEDLAQLDEVVVIGYGTTTKKDLTSSVSSVESEVLENQPTARLDQALQGRAAGVEVTSSNGAPGASATIRIRGASSINGNNDPLFVVDGFIAGSSFNLNALNVNDIESIQVLKDATALSIYGTRGAAGVVLITTKSGKKGGESKPRVSINHYTSVQSPVNTVEVLRGTEFLQYKNEAGQFVPTGFGATDPNLPLVFPDFDNVPNTDWVDLVTQTGLINNTDLSVSGNSQTTNYYLSLNHFDQQGVVKNSGLKRSSLRTNLDIKVSDKIKTGIRSSLTYYKQENNKVDFGGADGIISNVLPIRAVYDDQGNFTSENPVSSNLERNPVADTQLRQDHDLATNIISNVYLEYVPIDGLTFKSTLGTELNNLRRNQYLPTVLPERAATGVGGEAKVFQNQSYSILNENTVTYKKKFGDHSLTVLAGATWQKDVNRLTNITAGGFVNDVVAFDNLAFGSNPSTYEVGSDYIQRTYASLLSRIDYSYKSKYLLTLVGRRDGSSVFEDGNKFAIFPSVGVAWNVDEEDFIKSIDAISTLKLRASYGIVGEQGVAPYNSLAKYENTNTYFNENLLPALFINSLPSSNLSWETTKQLDLGLELALLDNRLRFEFDYYDKKTEDLLLERKVAGVAGDTQLQNIGLVQNKGFEVSLTSYNISNEDFTWETNFSLSSNKNEVLDLGGPEFINLRRPAGVNGLAGNSIRLVVGEAVPSFIGATYLGTYKTEQEIIDDGREGISFLGSPRYLDVNGDGEITDEDKGVIGSPQPDFYGGLRNSFKYKGISLDIFFQYSFGNEILNTTRSTSYFGRGDQNLSPVVVDRWIEGVNETSDIPRAGPGTSIYNPVSDLWVEDGSFVRLRTLSLAYDLPLNNTSLSSLFRRVNIYLTGNNLLLFSDFSLGDPEVSSFGSSSLEQGVASGQYPYARTYTLGVKFDF